MRAVLTQRVIRDNSYGEIRDALSHEWYPFLKKIGIELALPLPNIGKDIESHLKHLKPQLIVLTGGNDITIAQSIQKTDPLNVCRDETECAVLEYALKSEVPVIGVCRGMQFIHAYFGGELNTRIGHVGTLHEILCRNPFSDNMVWTNTKVNSYHNYCISEPLFESFVPIAKCISDNSIEAFIHRNLPIMGVMWHPERNNPASEMDQMWLRELLNSNKRGD